MAEEQEGLPVAPKESVFIRLKKRLLGRTSQPQPQGEGLAGTRTTDQITKLAKQYPPPKPLERIPAPGEPDYEPLTKESSTPEWERRAQLETAAQQIRASQAESTGITQQPVKTPDQLAEEVRIDAENLAKAQQPSEPSPKVAPFTQATTLPDKVFEPQPEIPGEHAEVDEFLKTKPKPAPEITPQAPSQTLQPQTPVETNKDEQPIPINIPQQTPVEVGDETR